jgi:hypothetical protein
MTRSEQLDKMTPDEKRTEILRAVENGPIRLESRASVDFWIGAATMLEEEGRVLIETVELEQETFLRVSKT